MKVVAGTTTVLVALLLLGSYLKYHDGDKIARARQALAQHNDSGAYTVSDGDISSAAKAACDMVESSYSPGDLFTQIEELSPQDTSPVVFDLVINETDILARVFCNDAYQKLV